ncbi:hypothetical protein MWN34_08685 [Ancylobacter sp. 6x-1]|uniref:Uncharacterized protein n=1 Tax=Ancylobacter crimeensis TaxID=2579147 RepID=A0ABT0DAR7_9HYPH|nr:hypothetical protein [Ancylobacter crimeensis]MCK0196989.1 hypothetical protein [Ancylobacter crimeensis]
MTPRLLAAVLLAAVAAGQPSTVVYADGLNIADFMTMDVCVDSSDRILPLAPGDAGCRRHRDIRPGETPPYELRNFGSPGRGCPANTGTITRLNLPVTRNGQTRIVSSNTPVAAPCAGGGAAKDGESGGASIQWHDNGYGFIMGSYSPVALSIYQTPGCQPGTRSSRRFFRGWVIAPAQVPAVGAAGYGVFQSKLTTGAASNLPAQCPTDYRSALTTWLITNVRFKSGRDLLAIVSGHFAQVGEDGASPGDSMQLEQTYWTREFGLSRWEKWARADWIHPRSGRAAPDLAQELFRRGRCSPPAGGTFNVSAHTRFSDGPSKAGAYTRTISDPSTGESHVWYMTLCEDYTNIQPRLASPMPEMLRFSDEAYWLP